MQTEYCWTGPTWLPCMMTGNLESLTDHHSTNPPSPPTPPQILKSKDSDQIRHWLSITMLTSLPCQIDFKQSRGQLSMTVWLCTLRCSIALCSINQVSGCTTGLRGSWYHKCDKREKEKKRGLQKRLCALSTIHRPHNFLVDTPRRRFVLHATSNPAVRVILKSYFSPSLRWSSNDGQRHICAIV